VALQDVDIINVQPFQAVFHRRKDVLQSIGQPQMCQFPSERPAYLAGEPMAVDEAMVVRIRHKRRATVFPNREEYLHDPS